MNIQNFISIRHWSPVRQILLLLAEIILGACCWLWLLTLVSPFGAQDFLLGRVISVVWRNTALVGFYLWLGSVMCLFAWHRQESFAVWGFKRRVYQVLGVGLLFGGFLLIFFRLCAGAMDWTVLWQMPGLVYVLSLVGALLLAGLEELLFRGILLQILLSLGRTKALVWQALLFTAVHGESWHFPVLAINLFLVALILGQLRLISGHLGWSIGLHAGWIWAVLCLSFSGAMRIAGMAWNPLQAISTTVFLTVLLLMTLKNDARIPSMS